MKTIIIMMMINVGAHSEQPINPYFKRIKHYVFQPTHLLGNGNFSNVYAGTNQLTNQPVAIKAIPLRSLNNPKILELHRGEIEVLMKLNHPNVIKCFDIIDCDSHCYFVTEICQEGDLEMYVKKKGYLTEDRAAPFIKDVLNGLVYLSSLNIVHRDLKAANVFISNNEAKISDFGFAVIAKQKFRDINVGSPLYMSPQGFIEGIYGPKTDVWAFGIFIYQLLHGDTPYSANKLQVDFKKHLSFPFDKSKVKSSISPDLKQVIFRCLQIDERKRISISELKETNYFRKLNQELNIQFLPHNSQSYSNLKQNLWSRNSNSLLKTQSTERLSLGQGIKKKVNNMNNQRILRQKPFVNMQISAHKLSTQPSLLHFPPRPQSQRINNFVKRRPISIHKYSDQNRSLSKFSLKIGSMDNKKPVQKYVICNTTMSFKVGVNILHYSRCVFRCVQLLIMGHEEEKEISFLARWLMLVLDELNRKMNESEIIFEGGNKKAKMDKFREVRSDYERKYTIQLKPYLNSFMNKPTLEEVKSFFFKQYRKYDLLISKTNGIFLEIRNNGIFLEIGYLSVLLYDATRLLRQCHQQREFSRFINYKELEDTMSRVKEKFDPQSFSAIKKRIIINS